MLLNTGETYGLIAQVLHWVVAALIMVLFALGLFMHDLPDSSASQVVFKSWFYSVHKTLGVTALLVAVTRVVWTVCHARPGTLVAHTKLESLAAKTIHWMLYGATILMPLTGWLHHSASEGAAAIWWPFSQDLLLVPKSAQLAMFFGSAHFFTAVLLGFSLFLHVAGAFKHAVIDRDATLQRMIPGYGATVSGEFSKSPLNRIPVFLAVVSFLAVGFAASFAVNPQGAVVKQSSVRQTGNKATGWLIDREKSHLTIEIVQMGNPVSGTFHNWDAAINFDPQNLNAASVEVEVDIASISLGAVSEQAKGPDFLNAAVHRSASFMSEGIVSSGAGSYQMRGVLALVGRRQQVSLPFTLKIENNRAYVEAEVTLERLAFGIGEKGFPGDSQLGFGVLVKVLLEAERLPSS